MKKYLRNLVVLVFLIVCTVVFAPSAFALGQTMNLTVTTVIDNAADYPAQVAGMSAKYTAQRIYKMNYSSSTAYVPSLTSSKTFNIENGSTSTLKYSSNSNANCDTLWFSSNQYTDKHLSLVSLEYTQSDNLRPYTYSPTGSLPNSYAIDPFNWVEVIDSGKSASITLHFKYNPDIGSVEPDPDPDPAYAKTVDYLGDGVANPDTTAHGVNDYRLSLDLLTQQATEENKADIVFVLDVSGSMGQSLSSGQSKISLLKSTMANAINNLTTNPNNRISIIKFSNSSQVLVSNSSNKTTLLNAINGLSANGCTNYYASLLDAISQVNTMTSTDALNRDKVVIFLTDGEPTFATPAAVSTSTNNYAGYVYACDAAHKFSNVDNFYSVFIGENTGSASTLQTITQMIDVSQEKYMVQATSAQQLTDTFNRFMSKMSSSLYNVIISDGLSDYVDYTGSMKVTSAVGSNTPVMLTAGIHYSVTAGTGNISVKFLDALKANTKYTVSFNVRSSDQALSTYQNNQSYPDIGDQGTDYPGNATSGGKAGFYSNSAASLKYSFGTNGTAEKAYPKPVVQVVEPAPVSADIELTKVLNGKDLEDGMFEFEVSQVTNDGDVVLGTVTNKADGAIDLEPLDTLNLKELGAYTFKFKEKIPSEPAKGMVYDTRTLPVNVTVTRQGDALVTEVTYPDGKQFVNTYAPEPVYVTLEAEKELTGKTLTADMFSFNLLDNLGVAIDTAQNDASGHIQFKPVEITKAGIYKYQIRESVPYPNSDPHIIYDLKTVTATVTVSDNDGVLLADVVYAPEATFQNQYVFTPANETFKVTKVLTGMQLTAGMFTFELKDLGTGETWELTNQADGTVAKTFNYSVPGTYKYSVREKVPVTPMKHMAYDDKTINITVTVTDDGSGNLVSEASYSSEKFVNSYRVQGSIW